MSWYKSWFGRDYLELYQHRDDEQAKAEVEFIIDQTSWSPKHLGLDIGCGRARHAKFLADKNRKIFGIDYSLEALLTFKNESPLSYPHLLRADMRFLPFRPNCFDIALSLFTSFGYFQSDEDHLALLKEWRRILKPEGYLFIDYLNKASVCKNLIPESLRELGQRRATERRSISADGLRVEKRITMESKLESTEYMESVRMYDQLELTEMLKQSGFIVKKTLGSFTGLPFEESSPRLIILAAKT